MDHEALASYCLSKPGTFADYPFGPEFMVMKVGSKMFALIYERGGKLNVSLKCEPLLAEIIRKQYAAVTAGYHLNKRHWNTILMDYSVPIAEIHSMIDHSYRLVFDKLTNAEKKKIVSAGG